MTQLSDTAKKAHPVLHKPDGWVVLDKPLGVSSAKAVAMVRKAFGVKKAGHAGTLDPLASGVLPIALGEATKTVSYVMSAEKSYAFSVSWGNETTTDDAEGSPTRQTDIIPNEAQIKDALPKFIGVIDQVPPAYSAVKIGGKRAYALARAKDKRVANAQIPEDGISKDGISKDGTSEDTAPQSKVDDITLTARPIRIDSFVLTGHEQTQTGVISHFQVACGKGAYIRALARDLGRVLGSACYVTALRRLSVGRFSVDDAISLDFLAEMRQGAAALSALTPIMAVLDDIPAIVMSNAQAQQLRFGQQVMLDAALPAAEIYLAVLDDTPVALVRQEAGLIKPVRVLNC